MNEIAKQIYREPEIAIPVDTAGMKEIIKAGIDYYLEPLSEQQLDIGAQAIKDTQASKSTEI